MIFCLFWSASGLTKISSIPVKEDRQTTSWSKQRNNCERIHHFLQKSPKMVTKRDKTHDGWGQTERDTFVWLLKIDGNKNFFKRGKKITVSKIKCWPREIVELPSLKILTWLDTALHKLTRQDLLWAESCITSPPRVPPRLNYSKTLHVQHFCGDQWDSFVLRFITQKSLTVPLHVPSLSSPCSLLPIMNLSLLPRLLLNLINLISNSFCSVLNHLIFTKH